MNPSMSSQFNGILEGDGNLGGGTQLKVKELGFCTQTPRDNI
jgi:hypothetical protein